MIKLLLISAVAFFLLSLLFLSIDLFFTGILVLSGLGCLLTAAIANELKKLKELL